MFQDATWRLTQEQLTAESVSFKRYHYAASERLLIIGGELCSIISNGNIDLRYREFTCICLIMYSSINVY